MSGKKEKNMCTAPRYDESVDRRNYEAKAISKDKRYASQNGDMRDSVPHRYGKKGLCRKGEISACTGLSSLSISQAR